ncbi:protein RADIALIS-like 3 [Amborella trichopoda]|uniref:protein RADIALIS-like 3 n=1 Tax=Amborella trichopoda TaxID=13333 RepID=UPI0009BCBCD9|nr:protein RADIALIS-like 3 [Amborella trichopoda]|eukprot:XP_011621861.2 protein RADIALIS-like 3 [Amborella trichopoda]
MRKRIKSVLERPYSKWTREENKLFELALAVVDEENPDRWSNIAAIVGRRSAEEVEKHYAFLVEDIQRIESDKVPIPDYIIPFSQDSVYAEVIFCHVDFSGLLGIGEEQQA